MNQSIENMIRRELERMGVQPTDGEQREQDTPQQQQYVPVEAVLSQAIGGPNAYALNDDHSLARALGADTLNGERI